MMTEGLAKLKGWASYSQKVDGPDKFHPIELSWGTEFWLDEKKPEEVWEELRQKAIKRLKDSGLIPGYSSPSSSPQVSPATMELQKALEGLPWRTSTQTSGNDYVYPDKVPASLQSFTKGTYGGYEYWKTTKGYLNRKKVG